MQKICCVTGHRDIPADKLDYVQRELEREISLALEEGYRIFLTGFAEGTDMLFARLVNARRGDYPDIFLEAALPYAGRVEWLKRPERELLSKCDGMRIICEKYHPGCFFQRNRYMVQQSSRVIAVYDGREKGGTIQTMRFAHSHAREVRLIKI